jgi:P pilus assembly chaperone PapD
MIINYLIPLVYNNINHNHILKNLNIRYIKDENKQSFLFKNKTNFNQTFYIGKNYKKTKNNLLNDLILKDKEKTFSLKKNYSILNLK